MRAEWADAFKAEVMTGRPEGTEETRDCLAHTAQ